MTETPNPHIVDADTLTGEMRPIRQLVVSLGSNLGERIERALPDVRSWDLNSGKYVGGYAIPELRHLTDEADEIILRSIGRIDLLPEIQYAHARMYKSTGMSATTLRQRARSAAGRRAPRWGPSPATARRSRGG